MDYDESEKHFGDDEETRAWASLSHPETDKEWRYTDECGLQCGRRSAEYMAVLGLY